MAEPKGAEFPEQEFDILVRSCSSFLEFTLCEAGLPSDWEQFSLVV
jgi:hypothetical protein